MVLIKCVNNLTIKSKLYIDFEKAKPSLIPSIHGGSIEYFKGHRMVYDKNNMFIGNIKNKRYKFLKNKFNDFYKINEHCDESNEHYSRLWYSHINNLMNRYPYKKTKQDILNKTCLPYDILENLCNVYNIDVLKNFTPFNTPINKGNLNLDYLSKNDYMFGSLEKTHSTYTLENTIYSASNIKRQLKHIHDLSYIEDIPYRSIYCIPILHDMNLSNYVNSSNVICIIPSKSIYLQTSDHWYDIEYNNIINAYPIAVCVFCNELSLATSPIHIDKIEKLEYIINKQNTSKSNKIIINKNIFPSFENNNKPFFPGSEDSETIYTDASIRERNNESVASVGIWYGPNNKKNVSQRIISEYDNDINYCELVAIYVAILNANENMNTKVYTDSYTSLKLLNEGNNNYDFHVKNIKYRDIVHKILTLIHSRNRTTELYKVKAHNGNIGNMNADMMARLGIFNNDNEHIHVKDIHKKYNKFNITLNNLKSSFFE